MWIDLNLALCLAAMSEYKLSTAPVLVTSLYSLYMLWVPDLESYLIQTPKFLTWVGFLSWTTLTETISPEDFLTLCNFCKKYQYLDLATTMFCAKMVILYNFGSGTFSVGKRRPITSYSVRRATIMVLLVICPFCKMGDSTRRNRNSNLRQHTRRDRISQYHKTFPYYLLCFQPKKITHIYCFEGPHNPTNYFHPSHAGFLETNDTQEYICFCR